MTRPEKLPDYLSRSEVERILAVASLESHRDYLVIKLMWMCGLRVSEVCGLQVRDIDFSEQKIKVVDAKGGRDRYVPIAESLLIELSEYLGDVWAYDHVFPSQRSDVPLSSRRVQQFVKDYKTRAKIKKECTPHTFRHSFAVYFEKRTKNLRALQLILGHSSISTTQIYLRLSFSDIQAEYDLVWKD